MILTFIGSFVASRLAVKKGVEFVKWVMVAVIVFTAAHLFNIIDIKEIFGNILN